MEADGRVLEDNVPLGEHPMSTSMIMGQRVPIHHPRCFQHREPSKFVVPLQKTAPNKGTLNKKHTRTHTPLPRLLRAKKFQPPKAEPPLTSSTA